MQNVKASAILKTLEGSGLENVLDINSSVLCSIIWLNPLEDPVINIPPKIKFKTRDFHQLAKNQKKLTLQPN